MSQKLKANIPYYPAISFFSTYPKDSTPYSSVNCSFAVPNSKVSNVSIQDGENSP